MSPSRLSLRTPLLAGLVSIALAGCSSLLLDEPDYGFDLDRDDAGAPPTPLWPLQVGNRWEYTLQPAREGVCGDLLVEVIEMQRVRGRDAYRVSYRYCDEEPSVATLAYDTASTEVVAQLVDERWENLIEAPRVGASWYFVGLQMRWEASLEREVDGQRYECWRHTEESSAYDFPLWATTYCRGLGQLERLPIEPEAGNASGMVLTRFDLR